jgi:hypothetical protein
MELRPVQKDGTVQVKVSLRTVQEGGNKTGRNSLSSVCLLMEDHIEIRMVIAARLFE